MLPCHLQFCSQLQTEGSEYYKYSCGVSVQGMSLIAIYCHSKFNSRHLLLASILPKYSLPHLRLYGQQKEVVSVGAAALPHHCCYHHFF